MKNMKRETVDLPVKTRKSGSKRVSFGVMAFCIGVMAVSVLKGMQLDKKEAELNKEKEENETEKEE